MIGISGYFLSAGGSYHNLLIGEVTTEQEELHQDKKPQKQERNNKNKHLCHVVHEHKFHKQLEHPHYSC
jgi:hypothetical protein